MPITVSDHLALYQIAHDDC